ncbi:dethiobiotin synthase [Pedobacter sp. HMWF019]|uniref:dethiobiotin synthase n=1 Tax=Pedobacter sp. HMWF019 TaxID=2056856 RepID=UPI000D350A6B|nr:dethiobiotin synthase [Pedobacter sp. HMWF019]PTT01533.1 dethiobiotin synthase [Pedobacter sp. HMWF019]
MNTPLFVTGIGTGIGKTIVSALITEQLQADYWKPVQAGDLEQSDSMKVGSLISNAHSTIHPEAFRLKMAASPHKAAAAEQLEILPEDFKLPEINKQLVIEGAGGLMVPLSETFLMIDLIQQLEAEVVLVIRNYLGCINHTLLSLELLKYRTIPIRQIVFNGEMDLATEQVLLKHFPLDVTYVKVPQFRELSQQNIRNTAKVFSAL